MNEKFEKAFQTVKSLAQSFEGNIEYYKASSYQEAEVRKDFIDPFFTALGWDLNHISQTNPYKQEVKVEKSQTQVGASGKKFADYAFYIAPNYKNPVFFVEAKKPSILLKDNKDYYLQTHKYGWNSQALVSVLTDFEELIIIDCRDKPHPKHASVVALKTFRFKDYFDREKFSEIYWLLSREAVADNSIKNFIENHAPKKRGKARQGKLFGGGYKPVDHDFLEYIDSLRLELAKEFYKKNPKLNSHELTEASQKTIDRLVFIRFLEDKQIEHQDHIYEVRDWLHFISLSKEMDNKYNGVVFKPSLIDATNFKGIGKVAFRDICIDISSKESPYNFNNIPIHILGSIYERFLGKVVVIDNDQINIEMKPEIRKAGGVFYTPKYVVDYTIENSVGKLIKGKTPKEIDNLNFADIACGSGSFLIGVYEYILDYHKEYYQNKLKDKTEIDGRSDDFGNVDFKDSAWRITLKRKQEILLNCIYGVDLDQQAVEVTQLSLFLKLLEEESLSSTLQTSMFSKVLPDLTRNIICGNSLIDWDIEDFEGFEDSMITSINPFNFSQAFPSIMQKGGFDAIVGNPPWVDIKGLEPMHVKYYFGKFDTTSNRMNLYSAFIHQALETINKDGLLAYIIPSSILYQSSYTKLRNKILKETTPYHVIRTPDNIFEGVVCETVILLTSKKKLHPKCKSFVYRSDQKIDSINIDETFINKIEDPKKWLKNENFVFDIYTNQDIRNIINVLDQKKKKFIDEIDFCLGLTPYDKYKGHTKSEIKERVFHSKKKINSKYKMLLAGGDVKPYKVEWGGKEYIKYGKWLGAPRDPKYFNGDRVLVRQIASGIPPRIYAGRTNQEIYNQQSIFNLIPKNNIDTRLICALLNSKLINFYHTFKYLDVTKKTFQKVLIQNCKLFPLPEIEKYKTQYTRICELVTNLEQNIDKIQKSTTEKEINLFNRRGEEIQNKIDHLICEVYNIDLNVLNKYWEMLNE